MLAHNLQPGDIFIPYWDLTGHCLLNDYLKEPRHGGTRLLRYALKSNGTGKEVLDMGSNARSDKIIHDAGLGEWLDDAVRVAKVP